MILFLALYFSILLVVGLASVTYCSALDSVVNRISLSPIPVPQSTAWYTNRSLAVGGTMELKVTINYSTGPTSVEVLTNELRLVLDQPENDISHWQTNYVCFGFFSNDSGRVYPAGYTLSEAINDIIYDPAGNVLRTGSANATLSFVTGGSAAVAFLNLVSFSEATHQGTYVIKAINVGQSTLNGTFILGYSQVAWSRPFLTMGIIFLGFSSAVAIVAVVLNLTSRHRTAR
jgi:hypothetical protein